MREDVKPSLVKESQNCDDNHEQFRHTLDLFEEYFGRNRNTKILPQYRNNNIANTARLNATKHPVSLPTNPGERGLRDISTDDVPGPPPAGDYAGIRPGGARRVTGRNLITTEKLWKKRLIDSARSILWERTGNSDSRR
ncbi:hypothetical protein EVAR_57000_1 [Eumeta japonica]|uniref:Uncharacterized protein n=1 Tax=Eumeta variegata TaxID=151549 RepID=A0A4C1ZB28_EUMVA|nr:hypothetical protein EVAR_57000_1 [Eumeta japonica]